MNDIFATLIIVTVCIISYWRTFFYDLVNDDVDHCKNIIEGLYDHGGTWVEKVKRRLYGAGTFYPWLSKQPNEIVCWTEHVFQTVLHTLACVLMYFVFGRNEVSLCAALLYAVNPANHQTAVWLNGRRYLINIVLVLTMMLIGPLGVFLAPITAIFQVNAVFAPVLLGWWGILVVPVAWLIAGKEIREKVANRLSAMHYEGQKNFTAKRLIVVVKMYGLYCRRMLFPGRALSMYPELFDWGRTAAGNKNAYSFNQEFLIGLAALGLTASLTVALGLTASLTVVFPLPWVAFFFLSVLQWCAIIPVTQQLADRYISLSNVFAMYFVSSIVLRFAGSYALSILTGLGVYYLVNLQVALRMYPNIFELWNYNLYWFPDCVHFREFKANFLAFRNNDPVGAWSVIKDGLAMNPTDMKLNMIAAAILPMFGRVKEALTFLATAERNVYIGQEAFFENYKNELLAKLERSGMGEPSRIIKPDQFNRQPFYRGVRR